MKKWKLFLSLILVVLCFATPFLFQINNKAYAQQSPNDSLEDFLRFENEIIELNNQPEMQSLSLDEEPEDSLEEENSEFSFKRLIVQGNIQETYGAVQKTSYKNLHVLCYASISETQYAYEQLSKNKTLDVMIDKVEKLEEYAEKDYTYTSYTNWGSYD